MDPMLIHNASRHLNDDDPVQNDPNQTNARFHLRTLFLKDKKQLGDEWTNNVTSDGRTTNLQRIFQSYECYNDPQHLANRLKMLPN